MKAEFWKKALELLKKFWKWIAAVAGVIALILLLKDRKHEPSLPELESKLDQLKKEQNQLEKEYERLKKEAEEIERKTHFNDPDSAADYLNDVLRRIQDNQKR